jgi:hypothetical protein
MVFSFGGLVRSFSTQCQLQDNEEAREVPISQELNRADQRRNRGGT